MKTTKRQRDAALDAVCGLLLIWMMVMHCAQWADVIHCTAFDIASKVFFFFMTWFFYKGGLYTKDTNLREIIRKGWQRLIIPFLIFSALGLIIRWTYMSYCGIPSIQVNILEPICTFFKEGSFPANFPLWFLVSLFFVRVLFWGLNKFKYSDWLLSILLVSFYLIKYRDILNVGAYIHNPLYIYNSFVGLIFYWLGYRMKHLQYHHYILLFSILLLFTITWLMPSRFDFRNITNLSHGDGDFMLFILSAMAACIVINNLFRLIYKRYNLRLLEIIGRDSMIYYCTHWLILTILQFLVVGLLNIDNRWLLFIGYTLGLIFFLPLCNIVIKRTPIRI